MLPVTALTAVHSTAHRRLAMLTASLVLGLVLPTQLLKADEPLRAWSSAGGHEIEARIVEVKDDSVILKTDTRTVTVAYNKLSESDREWIRIWQLASEPRTWKSKNRSIEGRYLRMEGGYVVYDTELGIQRLRYRELQAEDQRLVAIVNDLVPPLTKPAKETPKVRPLDQPKTPHPALMRKGDRDDAGGRFKPVTRTWTDRKAGTQIEADYLGKEGNQIILFYRNKEWRMPLSRFSEADRQFVERQRGVGDRGTGSSLGHAPEVDLSAEAERLAGPRFNFEDDPRYATSRSFENSQEIEIRNVNGRRQVRVDGELITGPDADRAIESFKRNERLVAEKAAKDKLAVETAKADAEKWAAQRRESKSSESADPFAKSQEVPDESDIFAAPQENTSLEMTAPEPDESLAETPDEFKYECPQCRVSWLSARERAPGSLCPRCQMMGFDRTLDKKVRVSPVASSTQPVGSTPVESTAAESAATGPAPKNTTASKPQPAAQRAADVVDVADDAPTGSPSPYGLLIKVAAAAALAVGAVLFWLGRQTL